MIAGLCSLFIAGLRQLECPLGCSIFMIDRQLDCSLLPGVNHGRPMASGITQHKPQQPQQAATPYSGVLVLLAQRSSS
jgi:hypothetical protein